MEFLGDRGSANDTAPFEHGDPETRRGKIRGADEAVVAAADDQCITQTRIPRQVSLELVLVSSSSPSEEPDVDASRESASACAGRNFAGIPRRHSTARRYSRWIPC